MQNNVLKILKFLTQKKCVKNICDKNAEKWCYKFRIKNMC